LLDTVLLSQFKYLLYIKFIAMRTKLFYFLFSLFVFGGCAKIKDATTINISTHLQTNIPVTVTAVGMKSLDLVSVGNPITFTKTQDLTLANNVDLAQYTERVKAINLNSLVVTISGLAAGQTINSVTLNVNGVGDIFTQANITSTNNSFTPTIAPGMLDQVASKLTTDKKITLTVSGNASGVMSFSVGLNIDTTVIVYTIK
jgi:hypothetical protein